MESNSIINFKANIETKVYISDDFKGIAELLNSDFAYKKQVLVISDKTVSDIYLEQFKSVIENDETNVSVYIIEDGQVNNKNVNACYEELINKSFDEKDLIIGLGGGSIIDFAGYIASSYKGGIILINVPTTLCGMCETSICGKTRIDYELYKNCIGSFYFPYAVYISTQTLSSLKPRDYSAGISKILKLGLVRDGAFYEWMILNFSEIMDKEESIIKEMLFKSFSVNQYFASKDPFYKNERQYLLYGELFALALEEYFDSKYNNGECLALGIIAASYIAYKRQMLSMEEFYEIRDMFVPFDLPISLDNFDVDKVFSVLCENSKITSEDCHSMVLLKKIGKAVIANDVKDEEIREAIKNLIVEWD